MQSSKNLAGAVQTHKVPTVIGTALRRDQFQLRSLAKKSALQLTRTRRRQPQSGYGELTGHDCLQSVFASVGGKLRKKFCFVTGVRNLFICATAVSGHPANPDVSGGPSNRLARLLAQYCLTLVSTACWASLVHISGDVPDLADSSPIAACHCNTDQFFATCRKL